MTADTELAPADAVTEATEAPSGTQRRANWLLFALPVLAVLALGVWWILDKLNDKNQLEWALWKPFFTDSQAWTTYLLPGLGETLKAAGLSLLIALPLGALFGIARLSDHAWVRVPAGAVVEFFRAIPVLLERNGLNLADFDFIEIHEAFAATALATIKALEKNGVGTIERSRLNVNGSSLAAGHPFAATGARIVASLAKMLAEKGPGSKGLISICTAGGQGVTAILEAI